MTKAIENLVNQEEKIINVKSVEQLLSSTSLNISRILDKALEEKEITVEEGIELFKANPAKDLNAIMLTANELRRRAVGDTITYVKTRNINFSNVCYTGCKFCAFAASEKDEDAYFVPLGEISQRAKDAWDIGATEVCIQGGLHPKIDGTYYHEILRSIKNVVPHMHIHAYSPFEIKFGAWKQGVTIEEHLKSLKDAGLDTIPGTAAEILDTEIRQQLTKDKLSAEEWVHIVKTAHKLGIRSTSTMMYGHIDGPEHWANHIGILREIQKETGGFTEFVPLGFVHYNTKLFNELGSRAGSTGIEDIMVTAVSRIMLYKWIDNIQVSWVKNGPKSCQIILNAGANDFGGTLMDETISRSAGAPFGENMDPKEFDRLIRDLGRTPAVRNTLYEILEYPK
ncbi:5-amino-6-(D-ribitylamino)uracil--L-tyrosine 4-hydroxyphenyl transferase CofH [Alkalihalobacterium alkalinitrilicum]|uniref:5-amino-6-(D-ribitylamino)uracil--L-tyrosine 4-hydroxyphenyl transferase CofH n=1 Tax=Alkalihalobacterium alkalinitrilicum TaxID=427920 RepID=UPI001303ED94|nr:5-amino-6-(D-ribitylamino)uracil--L-tyrosine 4-hydroxyphenyl transferase CofH [Alkalihalobacterium alkalinitrilicum]